mmetsp:Transcript_4751/g.17811  ORF Transcript_4751/g.17811 Transcript_4751/m.17811 type:complete len:201 (+) Transcript_4751:86-688(+)
MRSKRQIPSSPPLHLLSWRMILWTRSPLTKSTILSRNHPRIHLKLLRKRRKTIWLLDQSPNPRGSVWAKRMSSTTPRMRTFRSLRRNRSKTLRHHLHWVYHLPWLRDQNSFLLLLLDDSLSSHSRMPSSLVPLNQPTENVSSATMQLDTLSSLLFQDKILTFWRLNSTMGTKEATVLLIAQNSTWQIFPRSLTFCPMRTI